MTAVSLALMLTTSAFAKEKGKPVGANTHYAAKAKTSGKNQTNNARYANQEVSYLKNSGSKPTIKTFRNDTARKFDQGYLPPAATGRRALPLLPYMEQSNLQTYGPHNPRQR
jgi:hypothetical protein